MAGLHLFHDGQCLRGRDSSISAPIQNRPLVRVYRTDGTEPPPLSTSDVTGSMALSPGARFIAVAPDSSFLGGVSVFRIEDGALISSRTFSVDTF